MKTTICQIEQQQKSMAATALELDGMKGSVELHDELESVALTVKNIQEEVSIMGQI